MSQQFDVEFFGAAPIDPSYVMMIEGGAEGDESSETHTIGNNIEDAGQSNGAQDVQEKPRPLVDRYASSGLCSIFEKITARLIEKTSGRASAG